VHVSLELIGFAKIGQAVTKKQLFLFRIDDVVSGYPTIPESSSKAIP
jgi:hypothetical protein